MTAPNGPSKRGAVADIKESGYVILSQLQP
jgi:hypothetical protein